MTDTQISVGMNVDGVVTGTEKAKRKISELGGAAREAGKGTGAIGDGMAGAATKVESATRNMVGSIQRQIAALEAGDKSSRKYQESLARMRGIDVAALKPYLDQLDAVKLRQAEAAKTAESFASSLGTMRMAGLAVAAAGGAVALFAKSIIDAADGLNDMSQRVGISVRELGKYQLAAEQSGASLESISKGVKGLSDNMIKHGDALRKAGVDATTADGAMQQLADVFADMPDGIEKTALATKLFGKAGMDLIPMLNLGSEGLRDAAIASADYAEQMAIMAPLADALNDSMAEIALSSKTAGAVMVNEFLPTLNAIALALLDSKDNATGFASVAGGTVKTVLQTLALVTSDVVFVLNGMGREIGAIAAQVAALGRLDFKGFTAIGDAVKEDAARARKELDKWQSDLVNGVAKADAAVQSAYNKRQGFGEKSGARGSALLGSLGGDSAAKKAISEANKELEQQAKILAELSGYTSDYEASQQRLAAMLKSGAMNQEAYNRAAQELVAKQPGMVAAAKAQAEAQKEITKTHADYVASLQKSVIAGDEELAKAQAAYDAHGKLASVLQEEVLARLEIVRDQIMMGAGSEAELNAINAQIKAKRELIGLLRKGEVRDASEKAAKDAADEWKKASEKIEQDITDALMRGFESGKGFAEVLRDTIENTFKTMVIRPVIQAAVQGGLNAVGLGGSSSGSLLGSAGNMASIYNAAGATGSVSSLLGSSSMGALDIGGVAVGETAAGAMSAAASAVPYIAAAVAAISIADSLFGGGGGPKNESAYGGVYPVYGHSNTSDTGVAGSFSLGVESAWDSLAKALEIGTDLKVASAFGIDTQGDALTQFSASARIDDASVYDRRARVGNVENVGRDEAALQAAMAEETTRILFAALKASDLPEQYKTYLSTIGDSVADMTEAMTIVAVVDDFNDALQSLPFENLKTLSFEAAKGLIEVAGGMDVLGANLGTYYTNFYSAEEQRAQTIKTINATVGNSFDAASTDAAKFRATVEAAMLDTSESGLALTAKLLGVAGAMGALNKESEAAAEALAKTNKGWQDQLDVLTGKETERSIALRDAGDDSTRAIMQQVYAQEDLKVATQAAADSAAALATTNKGWQDQLDILTGAQTERSIALRDAGDDSTRAIMQQVYAQEDLKAATQAAADALKTALSTYESAIQTQESALSSVSSIYQSIVSAAESAASAATSATSAVVSAQEGITSGYLSAQDAVAAAQENVANIARQAADEMRGFANSIKDFLKTMATTDLGANSQAEQYAALQADFAITSAQAKSGDTAALGKVTGIAQNLLTLGKDQSATATDFARLSASVGNTLTDIATLADGRAGPLAEAVDPMVAAQTELVAAQADLAKWTAAAATSGASTEKATTDYLTEWRKASSAAAAADATNAQAQADLLKAQELTYGLDLRITTAMEQLATAMSGYTQATKDVATTQGDLVNAAYAAIGRSGIGNGSTQIDQAGYDYWREQLSTGAVSASSFATTFLSTVAAYSGSGAELYSQAIEKAKALLASGKDLPGFAVGTNYVPQDMVAQIHQGEAIVPKAYNPAAGGQNNAELVAEIRALRQEVASLKASNEATAKATSKFASQFETASEGGRALLTEVYA